jgi:hypothetical protein
MLSIYQVPLEVAMRSSWVHLFFHRAAAGGLVAHPSQGPNQPVPLLREKTGSQRRALVSAMRAHPRLCLGIGDGTMHRQ